jgi:hypothetical protein
MYRHYQQYNLRCSLDQLQIFKPLAPSIRYVPIVVHRDALNAEVRYRLWPLIAFLMQLSFDFQFPAHHARNLIPFRLIKANEMHYFSTFGKELYMFQTDLLAIIRSLNTVYTASVIYHTIYVGCLLARSEPWNLKLLLPMQNRVTTWQDPCFVDRHSLAIPRITQY